MLRKIVKNSYFFYILIICFFIYQKAPHWIKNYQTKNTIIQSNQYITLNTKETINFPNDKNSIVIFWATWCGPCIIEMNRFRSSSKIDHKRIIPINPFQDQEEVKDFLNNNSYPFSFIENQDLSSKLNINVTPTIIF